MHSEGGVMLWSPQPQQTILGLPIAKLSLKKMTFDFNLIMARAHHSKQCRICNSFALEAGPFQNAFSGRLFNEAAHIL